MKIQLVGTAIAVVLAIAAGPASAANPQQEKMGECSQQASMKGLKGDAREKYMSGCLAKGRKQSQQAKMTACNKDAKEKHLAGDERKKFMSNCLKG